MNPSPARPGRLLVGVILLVALVLLGVAAWRSADPVATATLAGGGRLTIDQFTIGNRHFNPHAPVVDQLVARLPDWVIRRMGIRPTARFNPGGATNFASLWLSWSGPPDHTPSGATLRVLLTDGTNGWTSSVLFSTTSGLLPDGRKYEGHAFPVWPRRAHRLRVQIRDLNNRLLAETSIANPHPSEAPPWTAGPLPATQRDGDVEFSLTGLFVGALRTGDEPEPEHEPLPPGEPDRPHSVYARFRVAEQGQVVTHWEPYHVESVTDATGNFTDGNSWTRDVRGDEVWNRFDEYPLPVGEAWRLRVRFSRTAGFLPTELFEARQIRITTNRYTQYSGSAAAGAPPANLVVHGQIGPASLDVFPLGPASGGSDPQVREFHVAVTPDLPDHRVTLTRITDDQGRELTAHEVSSGGSSVTFHLTAPGDAQWVNATIALHRSRYVEFLAAPTYVGPPPSPPPAP